MSSFLTAIEQITPEIYESLKQAVELGKWENGNKLTPEQRDLCMQAMIAWENKNLPEEQRTGYMGGQTCSSSKNKRREFPDLFLTETSETRH
ncbi:hypothetical protein LX59_01849 [Azomonas agilis]|uniref:DUF1315 family protein n=1 Tax=Azomonas agilis TaxID=116849 RepID=A0A562I2I7_9GAMM|nr:DUF1315 family protein [Azomonas agilis]TWH64908.1 hypothetical protein LX59_01849 [Azomonas agilis]